MSTRPTLVLLGRPGCHLCDEMEAVVRRVIRSTELSLVEKNIEEDAELERRYLLEIPVLLLGDVEIARHRTDESGLRLRLAEAGVRL